MTKRKRGSAQPQMAKRKRGSAQPQMAKRKRDSAQPQIMKTHRCDAGFSLAALIVFATIASIFIAAAVPVYQMQAKRDREEELIFRGGEYTRAIQKYRKKFGAYPTSIDQLHLTNGLRFLRRAYKDPITGKDFRLITLNPDGSLNGSKIFTQSMNTQPLFGNTTSGAQMGQGPFGSQAQNPFGSQTQNPQQPGGFGQPQQPGGFGQPQQPGGFGQPQQPGGFGQPQQPGGFGQPQQPGGFGQPQQPGGFGQPQQPGGFGLSGSGSRGFGGFAPPPGQQDQGQQSGQPNQQQPSQGGFRGFGVSSGFGNNQTVGGGPIVGVASNSDKQSVMIYNRRQKYDEWEFVALLNQNGQSNVPQNPAGQRGNNPFQSSPGGFGQQPGGFGQQPGGIGGGSPFGPQSQNPFGPGTNPTSPPK
jgi:type II secretory pathway pseudopilin PulG